MARNGSGLYGRVEGPYVYNTIIDQVEVNAELDDIATALTNSLTKNGETTATANQPMGTYRHTSVGNGVARTDYASMGQLQDGTANWVDGGGTADAITATYAPVITALVDGQICFVRATAANATTTPTFSPNSLTARTIVKNGGTALVAGDIAADGHELILRYLLASTRWELLNPVTSVSALTAASATTANRVDSGEVTVTAHATTGDIFAAAANSILWDDSSGAITTTAFPAASKAGLVREGRCNGASKFTAGANFEIVGIPSGTTITLADKALFTVRAITTTLHRMTYSVSNTYTVTATGYTVPITGTAKFKIENGWCSLYIPTYNGTSNATTLTLTGHPACVIPVTDIRSNTQQGWDNGVAIYSITMDWVSGVLNVYPGNASWTASGTKGLAGQGSHFTYPLS